jgi:MoaA/NifB/PqqE/SkfB family radical SAM enzyme
MNQMADVQTLRDKPNPLKFRVSLDHPDPAKHDESRGKGNFKKALDTLGRLHQAGFGVSIARLMLSGEDSAAVDQSYVPFFRKAGVPDDITIIKFPEFHLPGSFPEVPEITENCMTRYLNADQRAGFMCNFSKMIVRKDGRCGVYACTLVDDVKVYDLGPTLKSAMKERVMLGHHRCYSCFACGASCSEGT